MGRKTIDLRKKEVITNYNQAKALILIRNPDTTNLTDETTINYLSKFYMEAIKWKKEI